MTKIKLTACLNIKCAEAQNHTKDCSAYGRDYPSKPTKALRKIHKYLCPFLNIGNIKNCTCDIPTKYEPTEEQTKARVIRQLISNSDKSNA